MEREKLTQIHSGEPFSKEVQLEVLNPIAVSDSQILDPAARLKNLNNQKIGLFWNSKARGDVALRTVQALLEKEFSGNEFTWFTTDNSTALAPKELKKLEDQRNDAIIATTGD